MPLRQQVIAKIGNSLEWAIQQWIKRTGKLVKIEDVPWLVGPVGTSTIGSEVYETYAKMTGANITVNSLDSGLLPDFHRLDGKNFVADQVDHEIQVFYERTVDYTIDVWSQWAGILQPFARILIAFVSRNIQQLNLPLSSLETSRGISSDIIGIDQKDPAKSLYTGWLRKLRSNGTIIYAGFYTTCIPSAYPDPCVKVVFPLPGGSATVILSPQNQVDGSFKLVSAGTGFGTPGYYRIHQVSESTIRVKYLSLKESIHVYRDEQNTLRTDHIFMFWGLKFLTLHYKICPKFVHVQLD
ncbi:MAG TPA: hypothetical protein VHL11_00170 [Phototrophicaceae bacterium]|jgi:hypothetical protein|nr:hypothetical protein [Phototrophicaceae bacterium]